MKYYDFTGKEYPPLSDVLEEHLRNCKKCQESLKAAPVPNVVHPYMTKPKLCSEWFGIIQKYAEYEGEVNNVVAKTETGAKAYHQSTLYEDG